MPPQTGERGEASGDEYVDFDRRPQDGDYRQVPSRRDELALRVYGPFRHEALAHHDGCRASWKADHFAGALKVSPGARYDSTVVYGVARKLDFAAALGRGESQERRF